jgi:hypothetical protein
VPILPRAHNAERAAKERVQAHAGKREGATEEAMCCGGAVALVHFLARDPPRSCLGRRTRKWASGGRASQQRPRHVDGATLELAPFVFGAGSMARDVPKP